MKVNLRTSLLALSAFGLALAVCTFLIAGRQSGSNPIDRFVDVGKTQSVSEKLDGRLELPFLGDISVTTTELQSIPE